MKKWHINEDDRTVTPPKEKKHGQEDIYILSEEVVFDETDDRRNRRMWSKHAYRTNEEMFKALQRILDSDTGKGADWIFEYPVEREVIKVIGKGRWWFDEGVLEPAICTITMERIPIRR